MVEDPAKTLTAWGLERAELVQPAHSSNNLTYLVVAGHRRYFLREYQNVTDRRCLDFEFELLELLRQKHLSFAIPEPIPSRSGSTIVAIPNGDVGEERLAALFEMIPGAHPRLNNVDDYRAMGGALAELDKALAGVRLARVEAGLGEFGKDRQTYLTLQKPSRLAEELNLPEQDRREVTGTIGHLSSRVESLYASLPTQVVHRDYGGSNMLMLEGRVSGVLDFEFAAQDLRAIDLADCLCNSSGGGWRSEEAKGALRALTRAYLREHPLTDAEIHAIPELMLLYRVVSLIHRFNRYKAGITRREAVLLRVDALLSLSRRLRDYPNEIENVLASKQGVP